MTSHRYLTMLLNIASLRRREIAVNSWKQIFQICSMRNLCKTKKVARNKLRLDDSFCYSFDLHSDDSKQKKRPLTKPNLIYCTLISYYLMYKGFLVMWGFKWTWFHDKKYHKFHDKNKFVSRHEIKVPSWKQKALFYRHNVQ